jgi:hypothetical protein
MPSNEVGKFNTDTGRWQAKLRRGKTLSGVEIAVKPANLLFEEGGGKKEEERRQEALEKKEAEAASQVIQRRRLSQEKDDDDGLANASSAKKKSKSKKKKPGHQGASASEHQSGEHAAADWISFLALSPSLLALYC